MQILWGGCYTFSTHATIPILRKVSGAVINVPVYAIADKYNVETLKRLAKRKFQNIMANMEWNPDAFPGILRQIYSTTPSFDRGLRNCAKNLMRDHKDSLRLNETFRSILQGSIPEGDFALEVLDAWVN